MYRVLLAVLVGSVCAATCSAQFSSNPLRTLEDHLLFQPKTVAESWLQLPPQIQVEDVWLRSADGLQIHAWWLPHPKSSGAILLCHGNAGNLSHWSLRAVSLSRELQQSVLVFDYPGYGKSGGKPSEQGCYAAADVAFDWLTRVRQIPAERIVLYGESLGGGVATKLAVRKPCRSLVLVRTFTCVPDLARKSIWTFSAAPLVHNKFDNLARIPLCTAPVFIAHGDKDQVIPLVQGAKLFEAARQPKRGLLLRGCGHNDDLPPEFFRALAEFLNGPLAARKVQAD